MSSHYSILKNQKDLGFERSLLLNNFKIQYKGSIDGDYDYIIAYILPSIIETQLKYFIFKLAPISEEALINRIRDYINKMIVCFTNLNLLIQHFKYKIKIEINDGNVLNVEISENYDGEKLKVKTVIKEPNPNSIFIEAFDKLRKLRLKENQPFKAKAYAKAIAQIKQLPFKITSIDQVKKLPGFGKAIKEKVEEILKTGTLSILKILPTETPEEIEKENILNLFQSVEGVGPKTAETWYKAGYRKIKDIPKNAATPTQWIGIQLYDELIQKIPRGEIKEAEKILHECLDPKGIKFEILGSYRRGKPFSSDIDILVLDDKPIKLGYNIVTQVTSCPIFTHKLSGKERKYIGIGKIKDLHRRIDVEFAKSDEYAYTLFYFTGPKNFNIAMRDRAASMGMILNEKGLFDSKSGEKYKALTEQDIFKHLKLEYLTPEQREEYYS